MEVKKSDSLFEGISKVFKAGRYHSWIVNKIGFPDTLEVTAMDDGGEVMALAHK